MKRQDRLRESIYEVYNLVKYRMYKEFSKTQQQLSLKGWLKKDRKTHHQEDDKLACENLLNTSRY